MPGSGKGIRRVTMKLVIYIGHHKVGSTALQTFLSQNWVRLAQNGILYPSVETRGFSNNLARLLQGKDVPANYGVNVREPHSALAYRMMSEVSQRKVPPQFKRIPAVVQMTLAIRNQVEAIKPDAVILCSEAFSNFGQVDPELITRLTDILPDAEVEIYCALRRPDEYLVSWHGQRLKVGEKLPSLRDGGVEEYLDTIHFNFRTVVEPWVAKLPMARLILRAYDQISAAGGSTEDFCTQVGATFPDNMIPVGRANKSLPHAAMEVVRRGNAGLPGPRATELSRFFLQGGAKLDPIANDQIDMFGAPLRADLAERFEPIHRYLSDLTGTPNFFGNYDEIRQARSVSETEAAADLLTKLDVQSVPNPQLGAFLGKLQGELGG